MNIGDVYIKNVNDHNFYVIEVGAIVIIKIDNDFIYYKSALVKQKDLIKMKSTNFDFYFQFDQKQTDLYTIKNIIE